VGAPVVTIEGLSPDGSHPIQRTWKELDVPECGHCQVGQIMTAAALLALTARPTDAQIDTAMAGNLPLRHVSADSRRHPSRGLDAAGSK
jgi:isoquinoline 1-oxidoreductase alpha subunit